jgi:hypothetical protein
MTHNELALPSASTNRGASRFQGEVYSSSKDFGEGRISPLLLVARLVRKQKHRVNPSALSTTG